MVILKTKNPISKIINTFFLSILFVFTIHCAKEKNQSPCKFGSKTFFALALTNNPKVGFCNGLGKGVFGSSGSGSETIPPITLTYAKPLYSAFRTFAMTTITPTVTGTISTCTISPTLPAGLIISNTCEISGTPTVSGAGLEYTIEAKNSATTVIAKIKLKVISQTAFRVYGTSGSFTIGSANSCSGALATNGENCLNLPRGLVFDSGDNLYVADSGNHRVLYFPKDSTTATRVYGQPSFISGSQNRGAGAAGQDRLFAPEGITLSLTGELYIADKSNHRVVVYPKDDASTANRVYGQFGSFTINTSGVTNDKFNAPGSITFDKNGNYYISELANHRVLYYSSGTFIPNKVYGQQAGNFTCGQIQYASGACIGPSVSANGLANPMTITIDPTNDDVYLMDQSDQRVLGYGNGGSTIPTKLFGQSSFTTQTLACTATQFNGGPTDANYDANGNMFITDSGGGHRVLILAPPYTGTPILVLGQTNFTTCAPAATDERLNNPQFLEFDSFGNLYVSDTGNNRILVF